MAAAIRRTRGHGGYDALFAIARVTRRSRTSRRHVDYGVMRRCSPIAVRCSGAWPRDGRYDFARCIYCSRRAVSLPLLHRATHIGVGLARPRRNRVRLAGHLKDSGAGTVRSTTWAACRAGRPSRSTNRRRGDQIRGHNLESDYTEWHGARTDQATPASISMTSCSASPCRPANCRRTSRGSADMAAMFDRVATVQTQDAALVERTSEEMGYPSPGGGQKPAVTDFVEPYEPGRDMFASAKSRNLVPADT